MTTPGTWEQATVDDVMTTSLLTVAADESILLAYELASRAGVHHLPVMSDGSCVGVVDIKTLRSWSMAPLAAARPTVGELADLSRLSIESGRPIGEGARLMDEANADAVLVLDASGTLVGMVTWRDIVRFVAGVHRTPGPTRSHPVLFSLEPVIQIHDDAAGQE